jgi:hypothetical protein
LDQRPWLSVEAVRPTGTLSADEGFEVDISIKNTGKTPGSIQDIENDIYTVVIEPEIFAVDDPPKIRPDGPATKPYQWNVENVVAPNQSQILETHTSIWLNEDEVREITSTTVDLRVRIRFSYRDTAGKKGETQQTFKFVPGPSPSFRQLAEDSYMK